MVDYYLPAALARQQLERPFRVLDSGCGNGIAVDLLGEAGIEAWGNDVSALRKWQWQERKFRHRLVVADTRQLPFGDGAFDMVISSGVLEHVGVEEGRNPGYFVKAKADRDRQRLAFLEELVRVLAPGGALYLDFPNGAFPIDFWHGDQPGGARFHKMTRRLPAENRRDPPLPGQAGQLPGRSAKPARAAAHAPGRRPLVRHACCSGR